MYYRSTSKTLLGAAAMVAFGASVAAAQGSPTSTRRIPISKEAGGEVRIDTVYRTDTLRVTTQLPGRVDTVVTTREIVRVDTVVPPAPPIRLPNGLYFGLAGGVSAPNGSLFTPNSAGWSAQAQLGWQGAKNLLGVRGDVNYAQPGEDSRYSNLQSDPDILNFSANVKLQLPWFTHLMGGQHRFALYGIGGYTYTMFKNLPIRVNGTTGTGDVLVAAGNPDWQGFHGWNAGGGASLGWGRTELFLEARTMSFNPDNAARARQMPIMFGVNFY